MQMDAYMGVVAAIEELFLFEQNGVLYPMHGVPASWRGFTAENFTAPGGFRLSLSRHEGKEEIRVEALRDGVLKLHLPARNCDWMCDEELFPRGSCYERRLETGETLLFRR